MPTFRQAIWSYRSLFGTCPLSRLLDATLRCLKIPSLQTIAQTVVVLVGSGLLLSGTVRNWFSIPGTTLAVENFESIQRLSPACQSAFQTAILIGWFSWFAAFVVYRRNSHLPVLIAICLLLFALSFPFSIQHSNPEFVGDATWLHMQHDNLTWLGGDINLDAESGQAAWKSKVYWVDTPRQVTVAPLPTWSAWDFGLDKLDDVLMWIGYSNTFCQFAGAGWFHSVIGSFSLVLFSLFSTDGACTHRTKLATTFFATASVVLIGIALIGPFRSKSHLEESAQHLRQGMLDESLAQLHRSAELFPPLSQDTYFIAQKALIESRLERSTEYADLHQAKQLESAGTYDQAFEIWKRLCESNDAAIRRESLRAVLRFAIQDYNSNRFMLARDRLEFVLRRQPGNIKVIYYLQHLSIRQKQTSTTYLMCDWMYEVTNYLNFQTKKNASSGK